MCVIIHKPAGVVFAPENVAGAFNANAHGFGVMYLDKESGEIVAKKKLLKDLPAIQKIFTDLKDEDAVFHFRIKTHGPTNDMFCHPFQVLNKKQHGRDMWMMHNGIIGKAKNSSNESDTYAYTRDVLTDKLRRDIDLIEDDWFQSMVEAEVGGSKLVFLDDSGRIIKYNERYGDTYEGCWVSNKGFVPSKVWTNTSGGSSRHGGEHGNEYGYGHNDYPRRTYHGNRNNKSENISAMGPSGLCRLRGIDIKPGSKVHIFNVQNPNFYAMGTISVVEATFFHANYTDPFDNSPRMALFYGSGMTGDSGIRRLQCIPECFGLDPHAKIFCETSFWPAGQDIPKQNVLALEDKSKETTMEANEDLKKADSSPTGSEASAAETEETTSDTPVGIALVHAGNPTIQYVGTKPIEVLMDAKDCRWGGWDGGLDAFTCYGGTLDPECPELSLLDIYNMEPQDRLDWFFRYPQTAFGIFQDLVEQTIVDDPEVTHEGDIEEEDAEEEVSVEASREAVA